MTTIAVETLTDANKRIFAKAGMQLPVVTITDAAVSMVANTRYEGSIASFTSDRNYTLPAGTAGDVIEVFLTTGDDTYELILLGASGVSINGGSSATEWSRLFISNEFVRFRCFATNDWRVEVDGRIASSCELSLAADATNHFTDGAYTKIPVDTVVSNVGSIGSIANDSVTVRRSGRYVVTTKARDFGTVGIRAVRLSVNAVTELLYIVPTTASGHSNTCVRELASVGAGHVIFAELFHANGGVLNAVGNTTDKPNMLAVREVL